MALPPRVKRHHYGRFLILGNVGGRPSAWSLMRYIRKLVRKRRADPQGNLVSALARAEVAGDVLSEDELLAMVFLLLVAGHETTVNLIGNGTLALLEHPDQIDRLRNDPALIEPAVEELLRYTSPVEMATERYAHEDVTIAGVTIHRGEMVFALIASANRDERQFSDPDTLDLTREPNKHLSFELGPHFCLGALLARMEGQIAINALLRRLPDLRLAVSPNELRLAARPAVVRSGITACDRDAADRGVTSRKGDKGGIQLPGSRAVPESGWPISLWKPRPLFNFSRPLRLVTLLRFENLIGEFLDRPEVSGRRAVWIMAALFPVLQRLERDSVSTRKSGLAHAKLFPDRFGIGVLNDCHASFVRVTLDMRNDFLHARDEFFIEFRECARLPAHLRFSF